MTRINLLPWREQKRKQEKNAYVTLVCVCVMLTACSVFLVHYAVTCWLSKQTARNQMLQKEIALLDEQLNEIKNEMLLRQALASKLAIVQHLQLNRTLIIHLLDELIHTMPSGIYLTNLVEKGDMISLTGITQSATYVSMLMNNIENNAWFHAPLLRQMKQKNKPQSMNNEFKLTFILGPKSQSRVIK